MIGRDVQHDVGATDTSPSARLLQRCERKQQPIQPGLRTIAAPDTRQLQHRNALNLAVGERGEAGAVTARLLPGDGGGGVDAAQLLDDEEDPPAEQQEEAERRQDGDVPWRPPGGPRLCLTNSD